MAIRRVLSLFYSTVSRLYCNAYSSNSLECEACDEIAQIAERPRFFRLTRLGNSSVGMEKKRTLIISWKE